MLHAATIWLLNHTNIVLVLTHLLLISLLFNIFSLLLVRFAKP